MNINQIKKGFTLIEILIATTIFATIMVMTTGVVAESSGYQMKLKAVRGVSEESRRLADLITRDIRSANTGGIIKANYTGSSGNRTYTLNYQQGLALFNCNDSSCYSRHFRGGTPDSSNAAPSNYSSGTSSLKANTLVIFRAKGDGTTEYKIYQNWDSKFYLYTADYSSTTPPDLDSLLPTVQKTENVISSDDVATEITFGGYGKADCTPNPAICPINSAQILKIQNYVMYYIHTKSVDFNNLPANSRAETELRSLITARSF